MHLIRALSEVTSNKTIVKEHQQILWMADNHPCGFVCECLCVALCVCVCVCVCVYVCLDIQVFYITNTQVYKISARAQGNSY